MGQIGTFARAPPRYNIVSHSSPTSVDADHSPFDSLVRQHSDARGGTVVLLPALDSDWFSRTGGAQPITMLIGLAALAILALLIASAAHGRGRRDRARRPDDDDLFTTTPLPMAGDDRPGGRRAASPQDAFGGLRLPRWIQVGSLVIALGMTWVVYERIRPDGSGAPSNGDGVRIGGVRIGGADRANADIPESPEDLDLSPDSAPAFGLRARDWVVRGGGCAGMLEVTKGAPSAWSLTARVHDDQGRLIDSARTRVTALRAGELVEFRFPRTACDRIGAWDVRGDRRGP